jgi:hypothetical protein
VSGLFSQSPLYFISIKVAASIDAYVRKMLQELKKLDDPLRHWRNRQKQYSIKL